MTKDTTEDDGDDDVAVERHGDEHDEVLCPVVEEGEVGKDVSAL